MGRAKLHGLHLHAVFCIEFIHYLEPLHVRADLLPIKVGNIQLVFLLQGSAVGRSAEGSNLRGMYPC